MKLFERNDTDEDGTIKHAELVRILEVPRRKAPEKERLTDRECLQQIQSNRTRFSSPEF